MDKIWIVFETTIALLLCTVIFYRNKLKLKSSKHRNHLPLGTLGWPLIGETIEFISCDYSDRPESFIDKRRRMYGKVFKSHIFGCPTIVSTDSDVNKFILQSDANVFVPSYPKAVTELMGESSILLIKGSLQKRIHAFIGAFLKSQKLKAQVTRDMQKYVQESMENWKEDCHIYIQNETKKAKRKMVKLVQETIQARRNSGISKVPKDVVNVLLNDASEKLTDDLIADNIIDMMIPGENSVPVMTLAVKYLSECPVAFFWLHNVLLLCNN